ncbi:MAG: transporter substrate-binding protein [Deltaproteobacteria bacterium]|nr:transporter substrate-binding protein [Deltaproteobacteria bacterium]
MKRIGLISLIALAAVFFSIVGHAGEPLLVFCGAAFKQPMEDVVKAFKEKTKINVTATYGGVGTLLSQIILTKQGDVLVVPSEYVMQQAKAKGVILPGSVESLAYVVPAINVQKGNPKNIKGLADLARPSLRVAIANPELVFTGMLSVEIIQHSLTPEQIGQLKKNIVTYPEDFNKLATTLILGNTDVIMGLNNLSEWYPNKVETIKLKPEEVRRIGAGQVAVLKNSRNVPEAKQFQAFMVSSEGQKIFARYNYFPTPEDAFKWVGAKKPVGGERPAPMDWKKN